jgi:hypothetical protein
MRAIKKTFLREVFMICQFMGYLFYFQRCILCLIEHFYDHLKDDLLNWFSDIFVLHTHKCVLTDPTPTIFSPNNMPKVPDLGEGLG